MSPPSAAIADQAANKSATQQPGTATRDVVNFGGNVRFTPRRYYTPQTESDVLEILDRHAGEQIRVVGSRHAWSEAIVSPDVIMDLRHLKHVEITKTAGGEIPGGEIPGGEISVSVGGGGPVKCPLHALPAPSQYT